MCTGFADKISAPRLFVTDAECVALTSFVSISRPGIASDFASGSNSMDLPERYEFDFVASSSIRIMPLKRDFDLFLRIDFSTIFASVDALMWFAFACMSNDCSPLPNITSATLLNHSDYTLCGILRAWCQKSKVPRSEIIFVRGTTEAINMVAYAWGRANISEGDVIVTTEYEHHSNIVPWQMLVKEKKAILKYIDIDDQGKLMLEQLDKHLAEGNVKLVCFSLVSNVLGTISDAKSIISKCKAANVMTLVDAAQAVPHMSVNVDELGCDFFAFSSHKMLGPTGVGVLWARKEILETMAPFHGGGDMIREVHRQETTWNDVPYKFEAGTPNIADVIGFGAAIDYLQEIGMEKIREHEMEITSYALEKLAEVPGIKVYGTDQMQCTNPQSVPLAFQYLSLCAAHHILQSPPRPDHC